MSKLSKKAVIALSILSSFSVDDGFEIPEEEFQRHLNGGLTNQEIEEGYFIDPVLGKCNIKTTARDRNEAIKKELQ